MTQRTAQRRSGSRALIAALVLLTAAIGASAQEAVPEAGLELVDRIVVIVDEEAILQSDIDREVALYYLEARNAGQEVPETEAEVREEILERLIESKLIIAAARQEEIEISDDAVDREVQGNISRLVSYYGSEQALERALAAEGMTLDTYRKRARGQLRDQHYMRAVIHRFVRPNIEVREEEIDLWYVEHLDQVPGTPDSLSLSNILVSVEPDGEVQREIQRKLGLVLQKLGEGLEFAEVAREHSEGPAAPRGGYIGRVGRGDLYSPVLENAVFGLGAGETSQPVVSERGVHILHVSEADEEGRVVSQVFFPLEITEDDVQRAEAKARAAHARVVAGEDFGAVAVETSADPMSAPNRGVLGRFALADLSPAIQEQLEPLGTGDVTEPFLTPAGFYVFRVDERRDGERYALEDIRDQVRQAVEGEKLETELTEYVAGLRRRFVVDVKN